MLIDGNHATDGVFEGIPVSRPAELFTPGFPDRLEHPEGALREALAVADATCAWRPDVPVTPYASSRDRDVPGANAEHAGETLAGHGADVEMVDVGHGDHFGSSVLGIPLVLDHSRW